MAMTHPAPDGALPLRWPLLHFVPGPTAWRALAATLAFAALLLSFGQVVSGAVRQGELRRQTTAAQGDAALRCNALPGARQKERCLLQLSALPQRDPLRPDSQRVNLAAVGPGGR